MAASASETQPHATKLRCRRIAAASVCALIVAGCGTARVGEGPPRHASTYAHGEPGATIPFGTFAGYVWRGWVSSVQATLSTPSILPGSRAGFAGTWIGAEATSGDDGGFIQVGVNEESQAISGGHVPAYYAFWSDTARHFHPMRLFAVQPGDEVSASLALRDGRWTVTIADRTTDLGSRFATREEGGSAFDQADWLQEDVTDGNTNRPYPYPKLSPVRFRDLAVDGSGPKPARMYASWMSAAGQTLSPSPLSAGGFTLGTATVTSAGRRYLALAQTVNGAAGAFWAWAQAWNANTPHAHIMTESGPYLRALARYRRGLSSPAWPAHLRGLRARATTRVGALVIATRAAADRPPGGMIRWRQSWARATRAVGLVSIRIRQQLRLPLPTAQ